MTLPLDMSDLSTEENTNLNIFCRCDLLYGSQLLFGVPPVVHSFYSQMYYILGSPVLIQRPSTNLQIL